MQTLINILTILTFIINYAQGQIVDQTLKNLIENKLIEENQIKDFDKLFKLTEGKPSPSGYLNILVLIEYEKLKKQSTREIKNNKIIEFETNFVFEIDNPNIQSKINEDLYNYLNKLKNCGLVTENQLKEQKEKVAKNEYSHLIYMIPNIASQSAYEEWMEPENVIEYGESLLNNKVITENSFQNLKSDVNSGKIRYGFQIIPFCQNAILFDSTTLKVDESTYLEKYLKHISLVLPELSFTDFKYKIEVDSIESTNDYTSYKLVISIKSNEKIYKIKSLISPDDINKAGNFIGNLNGQQYYQIFNKVLLDKQSPFRLHQFQPNIDIWQQFNHQPFGVIALSKNQIDMFRNGNSYIQISYENFDNTLTSNRIDSLVKEYKQIGLFNHLTESQIEQSKQDIYEHENLSFNDILLAFKDVIYLFDSELGNLENPYVELVQEFKRISHNKFNAIDISDNFDIDKKKKVQLKFRIGNKQFSKIFKIDNDWIDNDFFSFIDKVVTDEKLEGKFYEIYTGGQEISVIYLTKIQYDYLNKNKLLEFHKIEEASDE